MGRFISALVIAGLCGSGSTIFAQDTGTKTEAKKAGEATKDAGKDTAEAAKHVGKATVSGTKKVGTAVKGAVTEDAYRATCNDGKKDGSDTRANVCKEHNGVKVWTKVKG